MEIWVIEIGRWGKEGNYERFEGVERWQRRRFE